MDDTSLIKEAPMWLVAGILLGSVVLASLLGFHVGPHAHLAAGLIGLAAAVWLVVMAVQGRSLSVLLVLLTADMVVSIGVGYFAWKGLSSHSLEGLGHHTHPVEGAEGVAKSDLDPSGIVRVQGENWSADSLNGTVRAGTPVQVIRVNGVRLEVWGEQVSAAPETASELREGNT